MSNPLISAGCRLQSLLDQTRTIDFLAPLALRLYLVPIFWMAGTRKLDDVEGIAEWFGNSEWGLGLPFPEVLAWLATVTETGGAILLLIGLGVRWISIPLIVTMLVAIFTVHLPNGWLAIAEGGGSLFASERTIGAIERLDRIKAILHEHGNYDWLTQNGSVAILNNGIEFATTYLIMLLVLLFMGGGRYVSLDYWIARKVCNTDKV
ncbi:MAG: DoxX family protein [Gammaproteobacteria bacterium]|nr:DoxX family protein [Gammaproteobacteria bacterium]